MEKSVEIYNNESRAGTFIISQGFGRDHYDVVKLIEKYKERFLRLSNKLTSDQFIKRKVSAKKAGRPVEEIMLNEQQTIFLGTLFRNTEKVLDFKERLASEFVKCRKQLEKALNQKNDPEWNQARLSGKTIRLPETDMIQKFITYAKKQGGTIEGCNMYYSNFTKMMNVLLFICESKFKNLRDVLTTKQLFAVGAAEQIIKKSLGDDMMANVFYKEIYKNAKKKVELFAELHGQSEVLNKQLSIEQ